MESTSPPSTKTSEDGNKQSPKQREERRGSMQDRWEAAVLAAKTSDALKLQEEKRRKLQQYLASIRSGLVRRRISTIEVLIMQQSASKDRVAATLKEYYKKRSEQTELASMEEFKHDAGIDDNYDMPAEDEVSLAIDAGSTIIIPMSSSHASFATLSAAMSNEVLPLLCGIYGDSNHTSSVTITAVAIPPSSVDASIDIALSVEVLPGHELDIHSYGYKKIALCLPASSTEQQNTEVYSAVLCIGTAKHLEGSCADDSLISDIDAGEAIPAHDEINPKDSHTSPRAEIDTDKHAAPDSSFPIVLHTDDSSSSPHLIGGDTMDLKASPHVVVDHNIDPEAVPHSIGDDHRNLEALPHGIVDDDMDPETALELQLQLLRTAPPAGPLLPELTAAKRIPQTLATAYSLQCYDNAGKRPPWLAADESLPTSGRHGAAVTSVDANVELSTTWVGGVSSTRDALVLRLRSPTDSGAAMSSSIIICAALKYQPSDNYFVFPDTGASGDCDNGVASEVFEWSRAAAKSGWLIKWPMQSQNRFGRRTTRYFVLRDRFLSYYNAVPPSLTSSSSYTPDSAMHTIFLSKSHTVTISRHHMRSCVKVDTGTDCLWLRCANHHQEQQWASAIREGIDRYSRHRVEILWQHEEVACSLIAADVLLLSTPAGEEEKPHICCALFSVPCAVSVINEYSVSYSFSSSGLSRTQKLSFIGADVTAPTPLALTALKLLCDGVIILGGNDGFIGIAMLDASCTTLDVICRQYEGHVEDATITTISAHQELGVVLAGDDTGGISLWRYRASRGLAYLGSARGLSIGNSGCIYSIAITPDCRYAIIGAANKLIMVGLTQFEDGGYRLGGWSELDASAPSFHTLYSVSCFRDNSDEEYALSVWKLVSDAIPSRNGSSLSTLYRMEWRHKAIAAADRRLLPIIRYKPQVNASKTRSSEGGSSYSSAVTDALHSQHSTTAMMGDEDSGVMI